MRHLIKMAIPAVLLGAYAVAQTAPSEVSFDEYGEVAESLTGQPGDPEHGKEVMTTRGLGNCIACHQVTALQDFPFHGEVGPSLDGAGERWTEAQLRGIVANAKLTFPDSMMPSFYKIGPYIRPGDEFTGKAPEGELPPLLSAQDIEDVVAFLMTLDS
jgi:L-cysteine S-thiosulfotransferase